MLGGSSAINGFAFIANSKLSIDTLANLGNPGWEWEAFSKSMNQFSLATTVKDPDDSPLQITLPEEDTEWPHVWRDTLSTLGLPFSRNALSSGGILGSFMGGETIGLDKKRSYSAKAYLDETVRSRENLTIWTQVTAERILFDKSDTPVAKGIDFRDHAGTVKTVWARKEIIISGGAINSPRLLELSVVGSPKILEPLDIKVVVDNPNVGEHLQNHPLVTVSFETRDQEGFDTIDQLLRKDPEAIERVKAAYAKGTGPGSKSNLNILAQLPLKSDPELKHVLDTMLPFQRPDVPPSLITKQEAFVHTVVASPNEASAGYMTVPGFMCLSGNGVFTPPGPGNEKFLTMGIHLAHPLSRGSVHITSSSTPLASSDISIDPNFFSHPADVEILARHIRLAEQITMTEPLSNHLKADGIRSPGMPAPGGFEDLATAKEYVLERAAGAHHWTGSCAMIPRELGGVIDPQLRVYGCANLCVCDASIIPISTRSNPQAFIYAIAEHASKIISSTLL